MKSAAAAALVGFIACKLMHRRKARGGKRIADHARSVNGPVRYLSLVGGTPLLDLSHMVADPAIRLYVKAEFLNPGFSVKDRIAMNILDKAEEAGKLRPGGTVVAASSGNTGAAIAMCCAMRGYNCVVTTSPKCSKEKQDAIKAYGAKLLLSPPGAKEGEPAHYMNMANRLAAQNPGWFDVDQYENQSNPEAHYKTLGPEIWDQTAKEITHFVAASSTGGTISGTARYLKEASNGRVRVVLSDPEGSIFARYVREGVLEKPGKFLVEGVGKGSIPGAMHVKYIDEVVQVSDDESFLMCSRLARQEGICVGGSSGTNVAGALKLAESLKGKGPATICTVACDLGVKYLSKVYNDEWLAANGLKTPGDVQIEGNFSL